MLRRPIVCAIMLWFPAVLCAGVADALPEKGQEVPAFTATDVRGNQVNLDDIVQAKPDLVILFFFTTRTGEEIAVKLRRLDMIYGQDKGKLRIAAIGWQEDEDALEQFAEDLKIKYYVLKDNDDLQRYGPLPGLPLTFIVSQQKILLKALTGSGEAEADLITDVAQTYLRMGKPEETRVLTAEAVEAGEDEKTARNVNGFALTSQGKLDEAQAEFGAIDSKEGLAKVALERGQYDEAVAIADEAGDDNGYAQTVKGVAQMRAGKLDDAATTLEASAAKPATDWQKAEAQNGLGRVRHEQGDVDAALAGYEQAVAIDPLSVTALSNAGAAHRQNGELQKAAQVLEKAQGIRDDDLVVVMLEQIRRELKQAEDVKRGELIRAQIADLRERYEALKAAGRDKPIDEWTTPPIVVAFLPTASSQGVFFDRAGMDVALRREVEARLHQAQTVRVVEREVLDKLLQELNLGTSELVDQNTQLQLGKVLSARMLGFIDFGRIGPDAMLYLRLVDTETTSLAAQLTRNIDRFPSIPALVDDVVREISRNVVNNRRLQGLIADATDEDAVLINLGAQHGVQPGQRFNVIEKGAPIEAGGKVLGHREKTVALLEVTDVEDGYAVCKVTKKNEGAQLANGMKIKQPKSP